MTSAKAILIEKFQDKSARVAVVGLGYVGLPLAMVFAEAGFEVIGLEIDHFKVSSINNGDSYIQDVPADAVEKMVKAGRLWASSDFSILHTVDAVSVCVPTPLRKTGRRRGGSSKKEQKTTNYYRSGCTGPSARRWWCSLYAAQKRSRQ